MYVSDILQENKATWDTLVTQGSPFSWKRTDQIFCYNTSHAIRIWMLVYKLFRLRGIHSNG